MLHRTAPVLPALNIYATSLFYREKLNFDVSYWDNYLVVSKEKIELYFFEQTDKALFRSSSCIIFINDIEDLYLKFSSMNLILPGGRLKEKAGRIKDFYITDNNGHRLIFTEKPV